MVLARLCWFQKGGNVGKKKEKHAKILKENKFNRLRASTYTLRKNCDGQGYVYVRKIIRKLKTGKNKDKEYTSITADRQSAFHHILPISTLQNDSITIKSKLDFILDSMAVTEWDINNKLNLIGLPLKRVYLSADKYLKDNKTATYRELLGLDPGKEEKGSIPNLPCHQVDHDKFNAGIIKYLNRTIWKPLTPSSPCTDESKELKEMLDAASNKFRKWLEARGKQNNGCAYCWENREIIPTWYVPFSMRIGKPEPRKPPPNFHQKVVRNWLRGLFLKL